MGQSGASAPEALRQPSGAELPPGESRVAPPRTERLLSVPQLAALAGASVVLVQTPHGFGSGFVVGDDLVATNLHVIGGQSRIVIGTPAGGRRKAMGVAGVSAEWDLAVLYVPGLGLTPLRLGDSERVQVGEQVLAVGNPEGLSLTVSNGIISKKHGTGGTNVLQTTAPISPGSSGGPLVDSRGAVVGVVTLFHREGQALNFAVASARLRDLLDAVDGRYVGLEQFAAATAGAVPVVHEAAPAAPPAEGAAFPAAVAGFAFGLDLEQLRRLCPELVVDGKTMAACPYLGVELDFATGPARFAFADGHLVAIALQPARHEAVLEALNDKYGKPIALTFQGDEWKPAQGWRPGVSGALQWNTEQGFIRYGSDEGAPPFLVFVSNARRAIQRANY